MPGAWAHPQLRVQNKKHADKSPQVHRSRRHSLRDGFTVSFVLSLVIGLCCHHPRAMQRIVAG
jgi:hypothetical protein